MQQEWLQQEVTDTKVLKMSSVHNPRDSKYIILFNFGKCFCIPSIRFEFNSGRCNIFHVPVSVSIPEDAHVGCGPPIPYSMYFRIAIYRELKLCRFYNKDIPFRKLKVIRM